MHEISVTENNARLCGVTLHCYSPPSLPGGNFCVMVHLVAVGYRRRIIFDIYAGNIISGDLPANLKV